MYAVHYNRKCVVCNGTADNGKRIFHRFPAVSTGSKKFPGATFTNAEKARIWAEFAYPESTWDDANGLMKLSKAKKLICSDHFAPTDYTSSGRLIPNAVPSRRPVTNSNLQPHVTAGSGCMLLPSANDTNDNNYREQTIHPTLTTALSSVNNLLDPSSPSNDILLENPALPLNDNRLENSALPSPSTDNLLENPALLSPCPSSDNVRDNNLPVVNVRIPVTPSCHSPSFISSSTSSAPNSLTANARTPVSPRFNANLSDSIMSLPFNSSPSSPNVSYHENLNRSFDYSDLARPLSNNSFHESNSLHDICVSSGNFSNIKIPSANSFLSNDAPARDPVAPPIAPCHSRTGLLTTPRRVVRQPVKKTLQKLASGVFKTPRRSVRQSDESSSPTSAGGLPTTPRRSPQQPANRSSPELATALPKTPHRSPQQSIKKRSLLKLVSFTRLSQLTPRKKKLYTECKRHIKELNRLKHKCAGLEGKNLLKKLDSSMSARLKTRMTPAAALLLDSQLREASKPPHGRRWLLDEKLLALTIFKKSPTCYTLLRRLFALPAKSTLQLLLDSLPIRPGICDEMVSVLANCVETMKRGDDLCSVIFDEMSLKLHVRFNRKKHFIEGFQDHGEQGRSQDLASQALCFMVSGVRKRWKQPIAYFLSGGPTSATRIRIFLTQIIRVLLKIKLKVVATVCDMGSTNTKAIKELKQSEPGRSYFVVDGHEIATVFDPPHLDKCTRNMLSVHDVEITVLPEITGKPEVTTRGTASWKHFEQLWEIEQNKMLCRHAPKLTATHIYPNDRQKMRVKFASQVLSRTSGGALRIYSNEGKIENGINTASFAIEMDSLFDSCNGRAERPENGKVLYTRITKKSPHLKFWQEEKQRIMRWKWADNAKPPSQEGWIVTINALEHVWKVVQELGFPDLAPRNINQDPAENMFGGVRQLCGDNSRPNQSQFEGAFKAILINGAANFDISTMNCESDNTPFLSNMKALLSITGESSLSEKSDNVAILTSDAALGSLFKVVSETSFVKQTQQRDSSIVHSEFLSIVFVSGNIVQRILNQENCVACRKCLTSHPEEAHNVFVQCREHDLPFAKNFTRRLTYPSLRMAKTVAKGAEEVMSFLDVKAHERRLDILIMAILERKCEFSWLNACSKHCKDNRSIILKSIYFIWTEWWCVLKNRAIKASLRARREEKKKDALKMQKIMHK